MKKIILVLTATLLAAALASCAGGKKADDTTVPETTVPETTVPETTVPETTVPETTETDPSVFVFEGLSLKLPDGFKLTEINGVKTAVAETYPSPADNITFVSVPATSADLEEMTAENMKAMFEQAYSGIGTVSDFTYDRGKLGDADRIVCEFKATIGEVEMIQKPCSYFFDGKCVTVTFTTATAELADQMTAAYNRMKIVK